MTDQDGDAVAWEGDIVGVGGGGEQEIGRLDCPGGFEIQSEVRVTGR